MVLARPGCPVIGKFLEEFRFFDGKILEFCPVFADVVEFPSFSCSCDEFPFTFPEGPITFMFKVESASGEFLLKELREETSSGKGKFPAFFKPCELKASREDVDNVGGSVLDDVLFEIPFRPMNNSGAGDATFVVEVLIESPWRVSSIGPS